MKDTDQLSEDNMKKEQSFNQISEAEKLVGTALRAHGVGMYSAAESAIARAVNELNGAAVLCKSLADQLAAEAIRREHEEAQAEEDQHL